MTRVLFGMQDCIQISLNSKRSDFIGSGRDVSRKQALITEYPMVAGHHPSDKNNQLLPLFPTSFAPAVVRWTVWEQATTAWTPCFPLPMALLITHLSHVHPLSHSSLPKACFLLEIPEWRTHDWNAIYKTGLKRSLCLEQPLLCLHFCENEFL